ncbi:zinc finger protein 710-like isoform X2 [Diabrotica virgifera virgifera]|uniref:C2H2-type domain-containing protein n=2 Tax=Diabrotica virgifera virgifera TaxID=50390 RepID=A0ABM5KZL9_DIAVI|nr:zinc finger protein 710-like isoform X2 [Diabrotica virgifera virgifera]
MEKQEYQFPDDINFSSFNEISNSIKTEDFKTEYDDVTLFAQLDNITNNLTASISDTAMATPIFITAKLPEIQNESTEIEELQNKSFLPDPLNGNHISHFVRYKIQDGKHVKIWECGICQKEFTHQYTLMRHVPTHTDERKFRCVTCGKAFRQMSTLSQHRAIHSTERPYICEVCQKTFNRVSTLISHRKTHTGLKPHRCHLCTKAFHQKGNLRNHIFTHTNARPYKCDICEKGFNQMSNLMCHKLKAHQRTEKPKYTCKICDKCFPKRITLRQHEQYTHKIISPVDSVELEYPNPIQKSSDFKDAIIVEPIKTEAMRLAIEAKQTPFALLRPITGKPVLVRVLPAGDKQMLVPATADDLKTHSNISITSKTDKENQAPDKEKEKAGNTVQIKIPVVATVIIQQSDPTGQMSVAVVSPGPIGEVDEQPGLLSSKENNFVYSCTFTDGNTSASTAQSEHQINMENSINNNNNTPPQSDSAKDDNEFLEEVRKKLEGDQILNELNKILENLICETQENIPLMSKDKGSKENALNFSDEDSNSSAVTVIKS